MTLARNAVSVYSGLCVRLTGGIATAAILARKLTVEDFGILAICTGIGAIFWTVCDFGISLQGQRMFSRRSASPQRLGGLFRDALAFRAWIGLFAAPLALCIGLQQRDLDARDTPLLLMSLIFGWSVAASPGWILSLQQRNWVLLPFDLLAATANVLIAVLYVDGRHNLWATFSGHTAANVALLFWFARHYPQPQRRVRLHPTGWFRFFLPEMGLRSAYTLTSLGLIVLYSMANPATAVAVYAAADRLLRFVLTGMSPVFTLSAPYLFSATHTEMRSHPRFRLKFVAVHGAIGLAAAVVMITVAPVAIQMLYGPKYDASIPIMMVLAVALPFWMMGNAMITQLLIHDGREIAALAIVSFAAVMITAATLLGVVREPFGMAVASVTVEGLVAAGGASVLWISHRRKSV